MFIGQANASSSANDYSRPTTSNFMNKQYLWMAILGILELKLCEIKRFDNIFNSGLCKDSKKRDKI